MSERYIRYLQCGVCGASHKGGETPGMCVTIRELAAALQAYVLSQGPAKYTPKAEELVDICKRVRGLSP